MQSESNKEVKMTDFARMSQGPKGTQTYKLCLIVVKMITVICIIL